MSPSTESESEDPESTGRNFEITRRDALISAVTSSLASAIGVGTVGAAANDVTINIQDWKEGGQLEFNQYADANLNQFQLGNDTTMSLEYSAMSDNYIVGEVAIKVDDGTYHTFGEAREDSINSNGGTVSFNADQLWGDNNGTVESDEFFDFKNVDAIDADNSGDYDQITFNAPNPGDPLGQKLAETHDFTLRFRFVSSEGTLVETKELMLTMSVGVPLGFGQFFGANFGKDHVESWPEDWADYPNPGS